MNDMQERIIVEAEEFAKNQIRPYAGDFENNEEIPKKIIKQMGDMGYLAASFPEEYNGLALDPVYYGLLTEQFGKACCSTRSLLTVHTSLVGESILKWGTDEQRKRWLIPMSRGEKIAAFALTEPDTGTDAASIKTNYYKSGDKYIINGSKKWITFGAVADIFLVIAAERENGKITAFIVDRESKGLTTVKMKGLLASRAAQIAEINFDNVEVSSESMLGKEGGGFNFVVNTALDHGRYSIAWAGIAIAQAALEEMVTYSRKRSQFGNKLCSFQLIKGKIADSTTDLHAARALCLKAGESRRTNNKDSIILTNIAKHFTSKLAMSVTNNAVQIHGGNGCHNKYPVERLFRESKILGIIEGTTEIQQEIISTYALRKYYNG